MKSKILVISTTIFIAVLSLSFAASACEPLMREVSIAPGVIMRCNESEATTYVGGEPVYKVWLERSGWKAQIKTDAGWTEGEPLWGYSLLEGDSIVFFLLIKEEPKKFVFSLPNN